MAYDNTNFYGDLIVSEYDDKGNFMTPQTPTGYYVYHILGDGFDLMSEMCNQFMNDFSILTASTKGLDNFWGVSYNMPRPLLYEGQRADYLFIDNGTITSHNDNWTTINSSASLTRLNDYSELKRTENATTFAWINKILSVTDGITIEFDLKQATPSSSNRTYFTFRATGGGVKLGITKPYLNLSDGQWHHYKFDVNGLTVTPTIDGVQRNNLYLSDNFNYVQLDASEEAVHHFKNFKVYTGEDKERPLTDDEYKIYLYLRNCRLMTMEDIEINMNKCFAVENENSQYHIFFSTETNYLSVVNHLSYNSKTTEESNLAKNDEDTSLNFITNFANDEDTLTIESGLSEVEEVIEVINVPSPNGYDPAFLELLENYISVKGNLKIKEYSI